MESPAIRSLLSMLALAAASSSALAQDAWKPARNVEIVVGVAAGGGIDRTARLIQKIFQDERLIGVTATVVNKPGGVSHYMNSRELAAYFDAQYAQFRATLSDLGLAR